MVCNEWQTLIAIGLASGGFSMIGILSSKISEIFRD